MKRHYHHFWFFLLCCIMSNMAFGHDFEAFQNPSLG